MTEDVNIGISATVIYFILFIYIYVSAYLNCSNTVKYYGSHKNKSWYRPFNFCDEKIGTKNRGESVTISYAFIYSNRYISAILIVLVTILIMLMLLYKNYGVIKYEYRTGIKVSSDGRITYLVGTLIIGIMLTLLLLFGPPDKHQTIHGLITMVIVILGTVLAFGTDSLYENENSSENSNEHLDSIKWVLLTFGLLIFLAFVLFYSKKTFSPNKSRNIEDNFLAISEICYWFTFGTFLAILSTKPPLEN